MVHNTTSLMRLVNQGMREWGIALHGTGKTVGEARGNIGRSYRFPQILYMPCGYKDRVEAIDQVPLFNVPCPCGNPNHWVVKYDVPKLGILDRILKLIRRK